MHKNAAIPGGTRKGANELADSQRFHLGQAGSAKLSGVAMRHARVDAKLSQQDIADAIGVNQDVIRRWENGYSEPRAQDFLRFMIACGVYDIRPFVLGVNLT